ncbi:MAG: winged helix-turn-helix domain-containing protein [Candidatus Thorarchaeota archaeon]
MVGKNDELSNSNSQELYGNTLSVYWFMFRENKPHSAREIQRRVGLSSSSLALHHLNKLIELGLVKTDQWGAYVIARRIRNGLLSMYIGTGRFFMPRFAVYASLSTGFLFSYLLYLMFFLSQAGLVLLVGHALITIMLWIETIRIMRLQPL